MGYRVFRDSSGVEWQTWDVIPHLAERRAADRRRTAIAALDKERRGASDRRTVTGERPQLSIGMDGGWLCFEAQVEKRRLTPIPGDWLRCDDACLERYCRQAKPAARVSKAVDVSGERDLRH